MPIFSEAEWEDYCHDGSAGNQSPTPSGGVLSSCVKYTRICVEKLRGFLQKGWSELVSGVWMASLVGRLHRGGGRFRPSWLGGVGVLGFFLVSYLTGIQSSEYRTLNNSWF